jgi:hypothetical protein
LSPRGRRREALLRLPNLVSVRALNQALHSVSRRRFAAASAAQVQQDRPQREESGQSTWSIAMGVAVERHVMNYAVTLCPLARRASVAYSSLSPLMVMPLVR